MVKTQGIPLWNGSEQNSTADFIVAGGGFLKWLGQFQESQTLGLSDGSLYDVLTSTYPGSGTAQVSATAFDITCGYISDVTVETNSGGYNISFPSMMPETSLTYYIPYHQVLDSGGNMGHQVYINSDVSLQFIQCSKSLVSQIATVSITSGVILPNSLEPNIQKTFSMWQSYDSLPKTTNGTTLVGSSYWAEILSSFCDSTVTLSSGQQLSCGDVYIMAQLGLIPMDNSTSLQPLYLHDIENKLSNLVASIFWIVVPLGNQWFGVGGHIHSEVVQPGLDHQPLLQSGIAMAQQLVATARLDISIVACSMGLGASIVLLILAITFSARKSRSNHILTSLGFLQIIWVLEHHPALSEILEYVEDPTDYNLRTAGLVKVRLADAL
ncbi:hypothetical protein B0H13DRAFT_1876399 [Mycena leptocephala]|nr:hypothetical protein B0H13DRAFT_1876399 [Mycena leptocephala]